MAAVRRLSLRRSSVVERAAVNRLVVGSSPTAGANCPEWMPYFAPFWPTLADCFRGVTDRVTNLADTTRARAPGTRRSWSTAGLPAGP